MIPKVPVKKDSEPADYDHKEDGYLLEQQQHLDLIHLFQASNSQKRNHMPWMDLVTLQITNIKNHRKETQ